MKIKCTNVKYDLDGETSSPKLPKTVTVEVNDDMLGCCVDQAEDGNIVPDFEEAGEMVEEAIEAKVGYPVLGCKADKI